MKANQRKELERLGLQIGNQHRKKRGWWWMGTRSAVQIHEAVPRRGQNEGHTQASSHGVFLCWWHPKLHILYGNCRFLGGLPMGSILSHFGEVTWREARSGSSLISWSILHACLLPVRIETKSLGCLGLLVYESPLAAVSCFCAW